MSKINVRRGIAAVLLLATFPAAAASRTRTLRVQLPARIHIRLVDMAGLPDKKRAQAEAMAIGVFRRAGVEVDFVDCLTPPVSPCREAPRRGEYWLQILKQRPRNLHGDSAGFAVLTPSGKPGDSYAAVSLPMAEAAARELDVPLVEILAASMAHEIGHLVLHSTAHSRTGIMSPRLDLRQMRMLERGELGFDREEAARLVEWVNEQ